MGSPASSAMDDVSEKSPCTNITVAEHTTGAGDADLIPLHLELPDYESPTFGLDLEKDPYLSGDELDVWNLIDSSPKEREPSRLATTEAGSAADVGDMAVHRCSLMTRPEVPQFFWESDPFLRSVFGRKQSMSLDLAVAAPSLKRPSHPIVVPDDDVETPISKALKAGSVVMQPLHARALKGTPSSEIESRRVAVLKLWASLVAVDVNAFSIGRMLEADKKAVVYQDVVDSVSACLAAKATSTLYKRLSAMNLFSKWCLQKGREIFPLRERTMYDYLNHVREEPNPCHTRGRSFLESVHFTIGMLGLQSDLKEMGSQRLEGLAEALSREGPPVGRAKPLTVAQVCQLERLLVATDSLQDKVMIGNMLVLLYSCARHSDGLRAQELIVDLPDDKTPDPRSVENQGFLELSVLAHKGAYTTVMKRTFLPVVAPMFSMSSAGWYQAWLQAREVLSLETSGKLKYPFLCRFEMDGSPSTQCTTSSEVGKLLKLALNTDDKLVRSHSLKVTLLSWCSKGGIPLEERKILGHHMDKSHRSAFTYGRDNAAPALRSLCELLKKVKQGRFKPDSTRSGRFRDPAQEVEIQKLGSVVLAEKEISPPLGQASVLVATDTSRTEAEEEVADSDSSSDSWTDSASDADDSSARGDGDLEDVDDTPMLSVVMPNLRPSTFRLQDDMRTWKHRISGIQHIQLHDEEKFLCGRKVIDRYFMCRNPPALGDPVCQTCLNSGKVKDSS